MLDLRVDQRHAALAQGFLVLRLQAARADEDLVTGLQEAGVPLTYTYWIGFFGPAKMPEAATHRLNREIVAVLNQPAVKDLITKSGAEPAPSTSADFVAYIKSDMEKVGKYIKLTGIEFN